MSDYIERLRGELLRAEAAQRRRVRVPSLRPALAVAAAVAIVALVVTVWPQRSDEREAGVASTYRVSGDVEQTARVLRERMAALGVAGEVTVSGDSVTIPDAARSLAVPGRLGVYDWEDSLIGGEDPVGAHQAETRGGLAVRAEDGSGWLSLEGGPALDNADVASAAAGADPMTQQPVVLVQLTAAGQDKFHVLTRRLAQQGSAEQLRHLGIVVDAQVYSVPYVDGRMAPDGLDGAEGLHISGRFTDAQARELAAVLDSGPLPGTLTAG